VVEVRCPKCNRLLGYYEGKGIVLCPRCRKDVKVYFDTKSKVIQIERLRTP
jgi:phage FluMu protein Com